MCLYHVSCGVPGYVPVLYVIYLHKLLVPLYVTLKTKWLHRCKYKLLQILEILDKYLSSTVIDDTKVVHYCM